MIRAAWRENIYNVCFVNDNSLVARKRCTVVHCVSVWNNGTTYRPWYENEESDDEFCDLFDLQEPDSDTESESPLPKRQPAP